MVVLDFGVRIYVEVVDKIGLRVVVVNLDFTIVGIPIVDVTVKIVVVVIIDLVVVDKVSDWFVVELGLAMVVKYRTRKVTVLCL